MTLRGKAAAARRVNFLTDENIEKSFYFTNSEINSGFVEGKEKMRQLKKTINNGRDMGEIESAGNKKEKSKIGTEKNVTEIEPEGEEFDGKKNNGEDSIGNEKDKSGIDTEEQSTEIEHEEEFVGENENGKESTDNKIAESEIMAEEQPTGIDTEGDSFDAEGEGEINNAAGESSKSSRKNDSENAGNNDEGMKPEKGISKPISEETYNSFIPTDEVRTEVQDEEVLKLSAWEGEDTKNQYPLGQDEKDEEAEIDHETEDESMASEKDGKWDGVNGAQHDIDSTGKGAGENVDSIVDADKVSEFIEEDEIKSFMKATSEVKDIVGKEGRDNETISGDNDKYSSMSNTNLPSDSQDKIESTEITEEDDAEGVESTKVDSNVKDKEGKESDVAELEAEVIESKNEEKEGLEDKEGLELKTKNLESDDEGAKVEVIIASEEVEVEQSAEVGGGNEQENLEEMMDLADVATEIGEKKGTETSKKKATFVGSAYEFEQGKGKEVYKNETKIDGSAMEGEEGKETNSPEEEILFIGNADKSEKETKVLATKETVSVDKRHESKENEAYEEKIRVYGSVDEDEKGEKELTTEAGSDVTKSAEGDEIKKIETSDAEFIAPQSTGENDEFEGMSPTKDGTVINDFAKEGAKADEFRVEGETAEKEVAIKQPSIEGTIGNVTETAEGDDFIEGDEDGEENDDRTDSSNEEGKDDEVKGQAQSYEIEKESLNADDSNGEDYKAKNSLSEKSGVHEEVIANDAIDLVGAEVDNEIGPDSQVLDDDFDFGGSDDFEVPVEAYDNLKEASYEGDTTKSDDYLTKTSYSESSSNANDTKINPDVNQFEDPALRTSDESLVKENSNNDDWWDDDSSSVVGPIVLTMVVVIGLFLFWKKRSNFDTIRVGYRPVPGAARMKSHTK